MAYGQFEGNNLSSPDVRALFTRRSLLASGWYRERLLAKQKIDTAVWERHVHALQRFLANSSEVDEEYLLTIEERLMDARAHLRRVNSETYLEELHGTTGAEPSLAPR